MRRRLLQHALIVSTAAVLVLGHSSVGSASETDTARDQAHGAIEIVGTADGFAMPRRHQAGWTTFRASTSHSAGGLFTLFRKHRGTHLATLLENMRKGIAGNRAESVAGGRAVQEEATLLGGAAVQPGQPSEFTVSLPPGSYHVVNYQDLVEGGVPQAIERVRVLEVTGHRSHTTPPTPRAVSVMSLHDGRARFLVRDRLTSGAPLLIRNAMPQLGEAVFMSVRDGTTTEQLEEFFEAANRDDWTVPNPLVGPPIGLTALSPHRSTIIRTDLPPGTYALVTWYPNFEDHHMLASQGQFKLITIT